MRDENNSMDKTLVCLHTVRPLLDLFDRLVAEILPGVKLLHILDEPLLFRVRQKGGLDEEDTQRVQAHRELAGQSGAFAILVTCSSISPCVDDVRKNPGIPIYKIDEAMIQKAVAIGTRIGVIATVETTLKPTQQLLDQEADRLQKKIQTELILVPEAFHHLLSGDGEKHDRLVKESVQMLTERSDVIVLAQASMARVLEVIPETERKVPVLSSPHLALEAIRQQLLLSA